MNALRAAVLAACMPFTVGAAPVELYTFALGDVVAHLHDGPCDNERVQSVLREPDAFRAANVEWRGQAFAACWAVVGEHVMMVDESGDSGFLQPEGFRGGKTPVSLKLHRA